MNREPVASLAKEQLAKQIGLKPSSMVGEPRKGRDGWRVLFEVTEKEFVSEGMELLGWYEVRLDKQGKLLDFERKWLRSRPMTRKSGSRHGLRA